MPKDVMGTTLSTGYLGSTDYKAWSGDGRFYVREQHEDISWSSSGLDVSTMSCYGSAMVTMGGTDPSTSPALLYLAAPRVGCRKTICVGSTAAYINTIDVDLGSGVRVEGTSDGRFIAFSSLAEGYQSVTLRGVSTSKWVVEACNSTLLFFGAATGIRATTAARTS